MKYLVLAALLGIVLITTIGSADAQVAGNKAFTLSGNGFAITNTAISDSSADITFSTVQSKTKTDFTLQNGEITIDQEDLNLSDLSGFVLQNGRIFKLSAKATDSQNKEFTINVLGRLVDKTSTDSIYTLSGTMTDSNKKTTKLIYTGKISEFTTNPIDKAQKSDVTIKILKGAATPHEETYQTQSGLRFSFVSQDRITISPGGTITFVNEDDTIHSLKSGTANYKSHKKTFTADGKVSSGDIAPGKSWSVTFDEPGFYRLFDEKYQWIDVTVYAFDTSDFQKTRKNPQN